jgi:nucleotide-binding universal stress UspA family protein
MIKDIVVNLPVDTKHDVTTDFAASMAGAFNAHLAAIAFVHRPVVPGSLLDGATAGIIQAQRTAAKNAAQAAIAKFEETARRNALSAESRWLDSDYAGIADLFARIARRFDISVVAQAEPDTLGPERMIAEAALFDSGRPVLIVPYIQKTPLKLGRVMACWDGSRSAARAIADALPLLARAKTVEIFTATGEAGKSTELEGSDIAHHLARHGLKVVVERQPAGDVDIASIILSRAADNGADLIVMGGYGHSRLREFVLGGATRGILSSMTLPVLMSH